MHTSAGWWSALLVTAALSACGSSDGGGASGIGGTGGQGGASSGAGGAGEILSDASSNGIVPIDGGVGGSLGGGTLDDAACASEVRKGEQTPLDLYILLDSSGSMTGDTGMSNVTKWKAVSDALVSFVNDPASTGLGVGLQYFPLTHAGIPATCANDAACNGKGPCDIPHSCDNVNVVKFCTTRADCGTGNCVRLGVCAVSGGYCGPVGSTCPGGGGTCQALDGYCSGRDVCETAAYSTPDVPIAALPGVAPAIVRSLSSHEPDGRTPTSSALAGALEHARAQAAAQPDHRVVVVLATDGLPTECEPTDIGPISSLASAASAAKPAISTFVIGVFSTDEAALARTNLDAIAAAGGSGSALIVQTNQDVSQAFLQALDTIRTAALACEYAIPKPAAGTLDYQAVNVRFTSSNGKTVTLGYTGGAANCAAGGGWYYDRPLGGATLPTKIEICPTTCNTLKAEKKGQVNVLFGCKTESAIN